MTPEERAAAEHRRAALGYWFWPVALCELLAGREGASGWYRSQTRKALQFGARWTVTAFVALVWPLAFSLLAGSTTVTIVVYVLALALDAVLFALWLRAAIACSSRAGRGETFEGAR